MSDMDYRDSGSPGEGRDELREDRLSVIDIVYVLVKHRWLILGSGLTAAVLIALFSAVTALLPQQSEGNPLPDFYQSRVRVLLTWVEMQTNLDTLGYDLGVSPGAFLSPAYGNPYIEIINGLMYGNSTLDQIAEEYDLYARYHVLRSKQPKEEVRKRLRKYLSIRQVTSSSAPLFYILEIGFISTDPLLATKIASRSVELLEASFRRITTEQIQNKQIYIEERLGAVERQMEGSKQAIIAFQRKYGAVDLAAQAGEQNKLIGELKADIVRKEIELGNLSKYAQPDDSRLVRLRDEIESQQQYISELEYGSSHDFVPLERIPQLQLEFKDLQRNLNTLEELYLVLKKEYEKVHLEQTSNLNNFQVIEEAAVPEVPEGPNRFLVSLVVVVFVVLLAVFWAFMKEYIESLNQSPDESDKLSAIRRMLSMRKRADKH